MKLGAIVSGQDQLNFPRGVAVDKDGNIIVADTKNNCIRIFGATLPEAPTSDTTEEKSQGDESELCSKCKQNKPELNCEYCQAPLCNADYYGHLAFEHGVQP